MVEKDLISEVAGTSGSKDTVKFDRRNPLNLGQVASEDEDENDKTEQDIILEQDIEGSVPKARRNQVRLDFDSDSSDDGMTRREKPRNKQDEVEEDEDMFQSDEEQQQNKPNESSKQKSTRFLDVKEFERRLEKEQNDDTAGNENNESTRRKRLLEDEEANSEEDDEEEVTEQNVDIDYYVNPDDENIHMTSEVTKKREPKIESFNLTSDLEEGQFDVEGNFIRNSEDQSAHQDQWLQGVSKNDISKARRAHILRENQQELQEQNGLNVSKATSLQLLMELLELGETPIEALQRLNREKKSKSNRLHNTKSASDVTNKQPQQQYKLKEKIENITEYAEQLVDLGIDNVYELTREELNRQYKKETGQAYELKRKRSLSPEDDQPSSKQWEFKWDQNDEIYGPYPGDIMQSWVDNHYFDSGAVVRIVGSDDQFVSYSQVDYQ